MEEGRQPSMQGKSEAGQDHRPEAREQKGTENQRDLVEQEEDNGEEAEGKDLASRHAKGRALVVRELGWALFQKGGCPFLLIGRFAQLMSRGLDSLQKNGHAKWKAVDFNYPLRGWEQYDCVRKYLGKAAPATTPTPRSGQNPVFDAIKGALDQ